MKRKLLVTLLSVLAFAGSLQAASDYLLEIDGIKGESADEAHKGSIEIMSWSWGMSAATSTTGGGGVGKVSLQDFHFVTKGGKASPQLMLACATGKHIAKATLHVRKSGSERPVDYYKITLEDVLVSSFQQSGNTGGTSSEPNDAVQLFFNTIKVEHTDDAGQVISGVASRSTAQ
jgi:type VI secretion system secreted protein Hcp